MSDEFPLSRIHMVVSALGGRFSRHSPPPSTAGFSSSDGLRRLRHLHPPSSILLIITVIITIIIIIIIIITIIITIINGHPNRVTGLNLREILSTQHTLLITHHPTPALP